MKVPTIILLMCVSSISRGQMLTNKKFVNDALNEKNYIIFNSDTTFKYRLAYHLLHDISCGQYNIVNDTIFLSYRTDLRDRICNAELINVETHLDTSLFQLRPIKLLYKADKLYKIENGKVIGETERYEPQWKISKFERKFYRRKYWLLGPLVSKAKKTYYMVIDTKAKWKKASR